MIVFTLNLATAIMKVYKLLLKFLQNYQKRWQQKNF